MLDSFNLDQHTFYYCLQRKIFISIEVYEIPVHTIHLKCVLRFSSTHVVAHIYYHNESSDIISLQILFLILFLWYLLTGSCCSIFQGISWLMCFLLLISDYSWEKDTVQMRIYFRNSLALEWRDSKVHCVQHFQTSHIKMCSNDYHVSLTWTVLKCMKTLLNI